MADDLGTAVLRITVNDEAARESLRLLRQDIQRSTRVSGAGGRAQGGARESIRALEQAQERRFRLAQRIERLENQGVNVSRLRARLGEQTTAQAQREFERSRRISVELNRQVRLAEARLQRERQLDTVLTRQARLGGARESIRGRVGLTGSPADLAFLARQGGARSPIGGRVGLTGSPADLAFLARQGGARLPIRGGVDIPGSPAFLAAELSRAARLGGARSPIGGAVGIPGSPAAIRAEERLAAARQRAAQAAEKASQAEGRRIGRLNVSPIRGGAAFPGSPDFLRGALPPLPLDYFRRQRRELDAAARAGGPRSPIRGGIGFPGSPGFFAAALPPLPPGFFANRQRDQQRQALARAARNRDIASNALIGGAFPLLFGQGIGASLGGGLGGAGGGAIGDQFGFGLSLLGTAVGAQFDAIIQKATLLGKALRDPIASFGELQQAGLLSSRGLERQVEALIAVGANASAAAVIQRDLANSYGGAKAARAVIESQDQLNRSWSEFSVNLGQLALPVFAAAAEDAASSLSGLVAILRGIGNLELPQLPSRIPDAGALSRSFLRVAAGTAGGGPAGFFNAVGGEVTRLFGRNRPDAQKQAADAVTNAQVRIQRIENLRLATQGKQLSSIAAQAQGYEGVAAALDNQVRAELNAADIADARRRKAEVQGDSPKAQAERAEIQREINRLIDEGTRGQQKYNEAQKAAATNSARQLALTKELVQVNPEERGFVQQRFDIRELQRQLAVTRAAAAADPTDTGLSNNVTALENQLLQKQLTLQDQLLRFQRDRAATSQLQIANYGLEAQALDRQFAAAKRIAAIPVVGGVSTVRDTAALREGLAEQVADARANEARIAAQIQAEQLRGGDGSAERIQQLQLAQVNAAKETRNAAFDAATRLVDAGRSLSQQIKDATRSIRSTLEGSFDLLRAPIQQQLLAQARNRINFSLFDVGRVRTPGEIFAAANASESIAQQENIINQANIASVGISKELVNVNNTLAAATQRLADKEWNVSVNVLGASGAQILGDVVGATT